MSFLQETYIAGPQEVNIQFWQFGQVSDVILQVLVGGSVPQVRLQVSGREV